MQLTVQHGDILDISADILVCSANVFLTLSGGVGGAFLLRYGPQMQDFLNEHLHTQFIPTDPDQYTLKLDQFQPRPLDEVVRLEDLFYCVHNAARCAMFNPPPPKWQFWNRQPQPVPPDFHPMMNGGVIQERRHALTWALSPDVEWDDTDLST